ncbi:MAG: hypothetical protein Q9224_007516, partial [Gallowayella concinna]
MTLVHVFNLVVEAYTFDVSKDTRPQMAVLECLTSKDKDLGEAVPSVNDEEIWDKGKAN